MDDLEVEYLRNKSLAINWRKLNNTQRENLIKDVVRKKQYLRFMEDGKKDILDLTTAQYMKKILNNLNKQQKEQMLAFPLRKAVDVTYKLIEKMEEK